LSIQAVDMIKLRSHISSIPYPRDATLLKALYLTACREVELLTEAAPYDLLHGKTKPYGIYLKFGIQDYEILPTMKDKGTETEKVLLITMAVAKRLKGKKKAKAQAEAETLTPQEIANHLPEAWQAQYLKDPQSIDPILIKAFLGQLTFKLIALPCSPKYEPWTIDLLKYISKHGTISFDLTRQRVWQIYRQHLAPFLPPKSKKSLRNPLRHWRISHLLEYYNFDPVEVTIYSGWTFKTTFGMMGVPASPNIDIYAHLQWKKYFPKLLREVV